VKANLARHELLLLRLNNLEKKADATEFANYLCGETCSELVQIIGHTVLIYKAGDPPKLKF
jgi:RNA-binding protein YhbY